MVEAPAFDQIRNEVNRRQFLEELRQNAIWPFEGLTLWRIAAERNVRPEARNKERNIEANGGGVTNVIRALSIPMTCRLMKSMLGFSMTSTKSIREKGDSCRLPAVRTKTMCGRYSCASTKRGTYVFRNRAAA
jgi:hypothetical protein